MIDRFLGSLLLAILIGLIGAGLALFQGIGWLAAIVIYAIVAAGALLLLSAVFTLVALGLDRPPGFSRRESRGSAPR